MNLIVLAGLFPILSASLIRDDNECKDEIPTFIQSNISCTINGIDCDTFEPPLGGQCAVKVKYDFSWCNLSSSSILLWKKKRLRMIVNDRAVEFPQNRLLPGKCKSHSELVFVNLCDQKSRKSNASLMLVGRRKSNFSQQCYSYKKVVNEFPLSPEAKCKVSASVASCSTLNGQNCEDLYIREDMCGPIDVVHTFQYCNLNSHKSIRLLGYPSLIRVNGTQSSWFDNSDLSPMTCKNETVLSSLDTCQPEFLASIILHAWKLPRRTDVYCYHYNFAAISVYKYSQEPGPDELRVTAQISCHLEDNENVMCDRVAAKECDVHPVVYTFRACNREKSLEFNIEWPSIKSNGVRGSDEKKASKVIRRKERLSAGECVISQLIKTINTCKNFNAQFSVGASIMTESRLKEGKDYAFYSKRKVNV